MDQSFAQAMRRALQETRGGHPAAATRTIRAALGIGAPDMADTPDIRNAPSAAPETVVIDGVARRADAAPHPRHAGGLRMRLGRVVDLLREGAGRVSPLPGKPAPELPVAPGGRWERLRFDGRTGSRDYRLYVPSAHAGPQGLLLLLHGCTQTPEDFVAGTRMTDHAERAGLLLVVPEQSRAENPQLCWNWFRPGDQDGAGGEPALLADLTVRVAAEHDIPRGRIFAAGLSAGGAMAAILGAERHDVFAAVGVHSGLPAGAARNVAGAFAAMRSGAEAARPIRARAIVFHGTADATVAPANGRAVHLSASGGDAADATDHGLTGRPWRVSRVNAADGGVDAEYWEIEGLGHAWSGGDTAGSYADPRGPDASAEMLRFFLASPRA